MFKGELRSDYQKWALINLRARYSYVTAMLPTMSVLIHGVPGDKGSGLGASGGFGMRPVCVCKASDRQRCIVYNMSV